MLQMPKRSLCDLVLDTIDIISARKNRPNLVRIYRHLHRLYDLSLSTCESLLQSLLKEGRVIRVTYKGNISYRNALKWKKYSYYMKKTMGSELPATILTKAISELVVQEPDYLNMGVPSKILENHLLSMKDDNINKETIQKLLQRELKHESLLQLENGNYFLGPKPPEMPMFDGEEIDLKFEKVKKVKTYKHDLKRLKDKTPETLNSSDIVLENNNVQDISKESSDSEELNESCTTTSSEGTKNVGLEKIIKPTSPCSMNLKKCSIEMSSDSCELVKENPENLVTEMTNDIESINTTEEVAEEGSNTENKDLNGELHFRPLEELVEGESCSSQAFDPEDNVFTQNDKVSNDKQDSNSPVEEGNDEELSLGSSDDSTSINNSDLDSRINAFERTSSDLEFDKNNKLIKTEKKASDLEDNVKNKVASTDFQISKGSPSKSISGSPEQKNGTSIRRVKKRKTIQPVERVQRKKRTKYDASDYYFPSLKRKTRDSTAENDKKEDKRRKRRKKDNGVGCLSGIFAKRVMFPGNTSMCCECNCYISKVKLDTMISCSTCANQGHLSCAVKTMDGTDWHCVSCRSEAATVDDDTSSSTCKTCTKKSLEDNKGELHTCVRCGDSYHIGCHSLTVNVRSSNVYQCLNCALAENSSSESELSVKNAEKKPTVNENNVCANESQTSNPLQFLKEEPPDYRNWSSEEVFNYFKKYLDKESAKAFMEQDIDGYALKLMGRSDVLNLGFKLGPSLKILFHVRRLQLRTNSLMEIWNN